MIWTLPRLLESALAESQVVLLRNAHGTVELRGCDLTLKGGEQWLTIFHAGASPSSESRSHLHLRRGRLGYAVVVERDGRTPTLEFWPDRTAHAARADGERPPLALMFRSFYDWDNGKAPIPEHRRLFEAWVSANGRDFDIEERA